MKKTMMAGLFGMALTGLALAGAQAQDTAPVQKPISIKVGAFFPSNGSAKDIGKNWLIVGGDYAFSKTATASPSLPLAYIDYIDKSKSGRHGTLLGIGIGMRTYGERATNTKVAPYYGAGVGLYSTHVSGGGIASKTKTQLGGKINAGVELNQGVFIEAGYNLISGKVQNVGLSGFTLTAGVRF